jgi:hypothetical protein
MSKKELGKASSEVLQTAAKKLHSAYKPKQLQDYCSAINKCAAFARNN